MHVWGRCGFVTLHVQATRGCVNGLGDQLCIYIYVCMCVLNLVNKGSDLPRVFSDGLLLITDTST